MIRLGVLISGRGSNLAAIVEAIDAGHLDAEIAVVLSNREAAAGLALARRHGLETAYLDHGAYGSRGAFDAALVETLRGARVELVALAGFDRLVTGTLLAAFPQRVLNVHPALLPAFKGLHAQRQAVEYGVRVSGATVHLVDEDMDHGPILLQGAVVGRPDDTPDDLAARILEVEHRLYPLAIQLIAHDRIVVEGRRVRITGDLPPTPAPLIWLA